MCWNATVSLQTFLFSTIPLVLCYYFKLIPFTFYITFQHFIMIQLIEYFLWIYLDTPWNEFFSKLGYLFIMLLPFNSIVCSSMPYKYYVLGLYLLFMITYTFTFPIYFHTSIAKNKHLSWDWLKLSKPFLIIYSIFFLLPALNKIDSPITLFMITTFFITLYTYYYTNTFGSMWCWIANVASLYMYWLLVRYFL
jgi:hypothetical protein